MNKRKIYTKPTMTILTMDTTPILTGSGQIKAQRKYETEEAYAKGHDANGGGMWEDETSDE